MTSLCYSLRNPQFREANWKNNNRGWHGGCSDDQIMPSNRHPVWSWSILLWAETALKVRSSLPVSVRTRILQKVIFALSLLFTCSPLSLHLFPLSNSLTWCVTHLSPRAVFKDNHVDREVTRRHCHPLCPVPVAAAAVELLPTSPHVSLYRLVLSFLALSLLQHTFVFPNPSQKVKKNKTKLNAPHPPKKAL